MSSVDTMELAKRYARAVFELAREEKVLEDVQASLDTVLSAIESHTQLAYVFSAFQFSRKEQEQVAHAVSKKLKSHSLVVRLLGVLARYRRLGIFVQVVEAYKEMRFAHEGKKSVVVISAAEMPAKACGALEKKLGEHFSAAIELEKHTDPALLGGFVVRMGSVMWDASTSNKLEALAQSAKGKLQKTLNMAG